MGSLMDNVPGTTTGCRGKIAERRDGLYWICTHHVVINGIKVCVAGARDCVCGVRVHLSSKKFVDHEYADKYSRQKKWDWVKKELDDELYAPAPTSAEIKAAKASLKAMLAELEGASK